MDILILKSALDGVAWRVLCNANIKMYIISCSEGDNSYLLSQSQYSFLLTKIRSNSKPLICSPKETPSSFEFTEVTNCKHSVRI